MSSGDGALTSERSGAVDARARTLARLSNERFDVLVVGGGATGAAIARDAAWRGLRVALCERGDYAGETSSYSSKLIHGGLRYLQQGNLSLVYEALADRNRLLRAAPHLCRPVDFLVPGFVGDRPSHALVGVGIRLYNALALWRPPARHEHLSPSALRDLAPLIRNDRLLGAHLYVDCQTDDARLVLETILDAEAGGAACASYTEVLAVRRDRQGRVVGADVRPEEEARAFSVRTLFVVNAAGPFSDAFAGTRRLRPTLGVHIVVSGERLPTAGRAFLLRAPQDGRVFFVLPGPANRTIIGTTDTDWRPADGEARPRPGARIEARASDVAYLLAAATHAFPGAALAPEDVLSAYAGLRPLLAGDADAPSATSREHAIWMDHRGELAIAGGKLTTMRSMAEDAVNRLNDALDGQGLAGPIGPCLTRARPLPGGRSDVRAAAGRAPLDESTVAHLQATYGTRARLVESVLLQHPELATRLVPDLPVLAAEIVHAARSEHARELDDALRRRTPVFRLARDQGLSVAPTVATLIARELGWNESRRTAALDRYRSVVAATRTWQRDEG